MTSELEEQFFEAFGIKKREHAFLFSEPDGSKYYYPKITDRILLELICIANKANIEVIGETVEETKNKLLEEMIYWKDDIIHKEIQQLFKEEE